MQRIKEAYETAYAGKPIYALEYSQFKRFYIDGDRDSFQSQYFDRRRRLRLLQALALTDDRYLEDLENILSAICDEFISNRLRRGRCGERNGVFLFFRGLVF